MNFLDWTLPTPEQNLAADEALLDFCEACDHTEVLRFWESPRPFVVVGYANRVATEVNVAECEARGVAVLRRCSGGGTVLQGPGCLNYALVLRVTEHGDTRSITSTNHFVMERNRRALAAVIQDAQCEITIQGHTDLTFGGFKFSGNAQRRRRRCLLFHGSFLLGMDLALVEQLLLLPSRQPAYRQHRPHRDFIRNLPLSSESVRQTLRNAWQAHTPFESRPTAELDLLIRQKYARPRWHLRGPAEPA